MGSYCIEATFKCNWYCDYCSADTHNRPEVTFEDLKQKISEVEPNSDVSITGGEPGLLDDKSVEYIFDELKKKNCWININTNGTFFKRHKKWCDLADTFLYHCSEDLDLTEDFYIPDFVPLNKIEFQLTLTDGNFVRLGDFLDKYPDIQFLAFGADEVKRKTGITHSLSKTNGIKTVMQYGKRLKPDSKINLISRCEEVTLSRDLVTK